MIKVLVAALLIWWAWRVVQRIRARSATVLLPAPEGARRLEISASPSLPDYSDYAEADLTDHLGTPKFADWSVVSASERPDKRYAAAIVLPEDPDLPELWVIDLATGSVIRLDSEDLIDWPGEQVVWPENDLRVVVFDPIGGYSRVSINLEQASLDMTPIKQSGSAYTHEQWFVTLWGTEHAYWTRLRTTPQGAGQLYQFNDYNGPLYTYFNKDSDYQQVCLENICAAIWQRSEDGRQMVDAAAVNPLSKPKQAEALAIQALLDQRILHIPQGANEAEIGAQLRQSVVDGSPAQVGD